MADELPDRNRRHRKRRPVPEESDTIALQPTSTPEHHSSGGVSNPTFEGDEPNNDLPERRRRRRQARSQPSQEKLIGEMETSADQPAEPESRTDKDTVETSKPERKNRRRDRRKQNQEAEGENITDENQPPPSQPVEEPTISDPMTIPDQGRIIMLAIHRTDRLRTSLNIRNPLVRVHFVDSATGKYLKKQNKERNVFSYYEDPEKEDFLLPVLSQPTKMKIGRSYIAVWEDQIIMNQNFNYISDNNRVIIFFEILDMIRATANNRIPDGPDGGWYRIAWAFLKPFGSNYSKNVDKKVRLQLYEPSLFIPKQLAADETYVFNWYQMGERSPYPSTLYVTIKGINPPKGSNPGLRSLMFNQGESGEHDLVDNQSYDDIDGVPFKGITEWNRLPGQICKVPNFPVLSLPSGSRGCHVVKFSRDGHWLAAGCEDRGEYPILLFGFPGNKTEPAWKLRGHNNLLYSLSWSSKSRHLASASADCTVRIWKVGFTKAGKEKVLAHPSYVYSAEFHPRVPLLVTGCFDKIVRIWSVEKDKADLAQEIDGHTGNVNSVVFDLEGNFLYSGDSNGVISIWNVFITEQKERSPFLKDWSLHKELHDKEIGGAVINHLEMHPSGKRLLIHTRDSTIRMMDLRACMVMIRYPGARNYSTLIRSTITPCGSFVFSGSEDMAVYIWNAETGDNVAKYDNLKITQPICSITYHPFDNSLAMSSIVPNGPITIYGYDIRVERERIVSEAPEIASPRPGSPVFKDSMRYSSDHEHRISHDVEDEQEKLKVIIQQRKQNEADRLRRALEKLNTVVGGTNRLMTGMDVSLPGQLPHTMTGVYGTTTPRNTWRNPELASLSRSPNRAPASMSMTASNRGRASFKFHSPRKTKDGVGSDGEDLDRGEDYVVAIYDYEAQRSDELSFKRGDPITVLYIDNDNWWMGALPDGSQGYFPTNYVTGSDEIMQKRPEPVKRASSLSNGLNNTHESEDEVKQQHQQYSSLLKEMGDVTIKTDDQQNGNAAKPRQPRRRRIQTNFNAQPGENSNDTELAIREPSRRSRPQSGGRRRLESNSTESSDVHNKPPRHRRKPRSSSREMIEESAA